MNMSVQAQRSQAVPSTQPTSDAGQARALIDLATHDGQVDTQLLGKMVAEAARKNPDKASAAYAAIEQE